jgi:hypothetical protein
VVGKWRARRFINKPCATSSSTRRTCSALSTSRSSSSSASISSDSTSARSTCSPQHPAMSVAATVTAGPASRPASALPVSTAARTRTRTRTAVGWADLRGGGVGGARECTQLLAHGRGARAAPGRRGLVGAGRRPRRPATLPASQPAAAAGAAAAAASARPAGGPRPRPLLAVCLLTPGPLHRRVAAAASSAAAVVGARPAGLVERRRRGQLVGGRGRARHDRRRYLIRRHRPPSHGIQRGRPHLVRRHRPARHPRRRDWRLPASIASQSFLTGTDVT